MPPTPDVGDNISRIRARRPLQTEIRDALLNEYILSNKLQPGDRLPSETELSRLFGASRVTIRTALQSLKDQGYIRIVRGSGSTVLPRPDAIRSGIDRLLSFDTYATQSGKEILTDDLEITRIDTADDPLADVLEPGPATKVSRTKKIGRKKVAWIVDYVPEDVLGFAAIQAGFQGSVLDLLLAGDLAEYSDCTLTSVSAVGDLRKRLGCPEGTPLLQLSELTRDTAGKVVNRSEAWLLPDSFTFQLRRRRES
ncbi:GntR family transcriptional regulator [Saccharopolyspora oryzae]|uniref:GntR family transcriptional regulator n=1 Tax=Saccharopolyspora oryzae TaxID=2997343 RepID=A0ABT4V2Z4_9PSEU|nr:GntR family transcriptional regulator [Saccharopolyspora oryzae]MDA3628334.1 GntR family transcriptional regulator [Saccharopolyspora oryzae]